MKITSVGPIAFAFALALGVFATPVWAQDDSGQDASQDASQSDAASGEDAKADETFLEKLEDDFKESTTPTDEETDAIGTTEDEGRDLY